MLEGTPPLLQRVTPAQLIGTLAAVRINEVAKQWQRSLCERQGRRVGTPTVPRLLVRNVDLDGVRAALTSVS